MLWKILLVYNLWHLSVSLFLMSHDDTIIVGRIFAAQYGYIVEFNIIEQKSHAKKEASRLSQQVTLWLTL